MDLKRLMAQFTYHIEPKPGGGFIAHASDPGLPPIEAPTSWELRDKIQQNINIALATEFPQLKLPLEQKQLTASFHLERKPDGGFLIHSSDPNTAPTDAASHEIENKFAEKLIAFAGKHLMSPELSEALEGQMASGDIKVFMTRKVYGDPATLADAAASGQTLQSNGGATAENITTGSTNAVGAITGGSSYSSDGSPIHRTTGGGNWAILRFLLALLILGAIMYFYLRYR